MLLKRWCYNSTLVFKEQLNYTEVKRSTTSSYMDLYCNQNAANITPLVMFLSHNIENIHPCKITGHINLTRSKKYRLKNCATRCSPANNSSSAYMHLRMIAALCIHEADNTF